MSSEDYKEIEAKMSKAVQVLKEDLAGLRAGRANPAILDKITVDYYGVPTPINQLGNITVPEARLIVIQPWDVKILKEIEKAIQKSDIGINPNNDGKVIRLVFPVLTEERRKELVKTVKKFGENSKVAVRLIRRDAIEQFKAQKKAGEMTEDDLKDAEEDIQKITDKYITEIDKVLEKKGKEIMEV
jgi:ribosome recycling factor